MNIPEPAIPDWLIPAERAVAGYATGSAEQAQAVGDILRPAHFTRPAHGVILAAALRLAGSAGAVDPVAVLAELMRSGDISALSSKPDYVHDCWHAGRVLSATWESGARRILEYSRTVQYRAVLESALHDAAAPAFELAEGIEVFRERLDLVEAPEAAAIPSMEDAVLGVMNSLEQDQPRGLPSPWGDLDEVTAGLAPGEVAVVGGITGTGKTIIGAQWAEHIAGKLGLPVLYASMEMTRDELITRLLSAKARVPLAHLLHRRLDDDDWARLAKFSGELSASALAIDDAPRMSLAEIRARLRAMQRGGGVSLLVIDYLTLLDEPDGAESRRVAILRLSLGVKQIAREFGIPVIVLAQLNREYAKRSDKRPTVADLAESAQIAQDANLVLLLHRPDQFDPECPQAGELHVIVDKNRNGPKTTVVLGFQGHYSRVVNMASPAQQHAADEGWDPSSRYAS